MSECAYCGRQGPFTREHLFPKWLYKRTTHYEQQFLLAKPDRFIDSQLTIRDVCGKCNHGALSHLDAYGHKLYDKYFDHFINRNEVVNFIYDFDLLTRWLLKLSYNSARVHRSDENELSKYINYIITGCNKPTHLAVVLRLIVPYRLRPEDQKYVPPSLQGLKELPPAFVRIARAEPSPNASRFSVCRMIGINSYYFYVLLPKGVDISRQIWRTNLREFESWFPGTERISAAKNKIMLRASKIDSLEVAERHLLLHQSLYQSAMAKTDNK